MIKIFFYYYQVCNLLRSSVGSPKKGQFMYDFENVISRVMNMILVNLPSFNCPLKDLRAVPKVVILHSVGYCLLVLLCLLYMIDKLFLILRRLGSGDDRRTALRFITTTRSGERSGNSKSSFPQRVASAFTCISLLMYASSAQLCLSLLHCVSIGDNQVLFLDGNIKCYQTFQYFLLALHDFFHTSILSCSCSRLVSSEVWSNWCQTILCGLHLSSAILLFLVVFVA